MTPNSPVRQEEPNLNRQAGRNNILVVHGARKQLKDVAQALRSVGATIEMRELLGDLPVDGIFDLLLFDYDAAPVDDRKRLVDGFNARRSTRLLLLSEGECKNDFVTLFGNHTLTNLIARNDAEVDAEELIVTVQKLLRREIFGLEKYFAWGVVPKRIAITRSSQKADVLREAESFGKSIGVHSRLINLFCSVADEFVTNAIYNAPVDSEGKSRYGHIPREQEIALEPGEEVVVKFSCDGRRLGISTADPFGSLTQERLLGYLSKCMRKGDDQIDQKQGGAGLGFYYIFESLSHFVVNISPGKRTEMIGLIDVRGSYKDFATLNKSFNIFVE